MWVAGCTEAGAPRWVPADLALFPYFDWDRPDPWLQASSSGVAAHLTVDEAAERAIIELIERDAMMWRWIQQVAPARILEGSLSDEARGGLAALRRDRWDVDLFDMTVDLLPAAMGVMRRDGQLGLGLGCARSGVAAAERALHECQMITLAGLGGPEPLADPTAVRLPEDHLALHHHPDHAPGHEFFFASRDEVDPREIPVPEEPLVELVRPIGETVFVEHDVPQVEPFRVVRGDRTGPRADLVRVRQGATGPAAPRASDHDA